MKAGSTRSVLNRTAAFASLLAAVSAAAAPPGAAPERSALEPRRMIALAPARRDKWRCQMRGHLKTLTDAIHQLAAGAYAAAAATVDENFGLLPGGQEYCRKPIFTREEPLAAVRLPPAPPAEVRATSAAMHAAVQEFSTAARRCAGVAKTWQSLAALGTTCTACHTVYRIR